MTVELLQDLNAIYDARVPKRWTHDASGAEISWLLPNMGGWFTGLVERQAMLNTWLENSRSSMKAYWLTGFTNAQGFLTGMRQEVTRQHKKDQWALDESEPKKLFLPMPVIYITGITLSLRRSKGVDYGQYGPYDCPIYKYPKRNDRYLIFRMLLKTEAHPFHWKLRGVSLMAQTE